MSPRHLASTAVTIPPPPRSHGRNAGAPSLHLASLGDLRAAQPDAPGPGRPSGHRPGPAPRGCAVNLQLRCTPEAAMLRDHVIDAGFDTDPGNGRTLLEQIVVADMAVDQARAAVAKAIDDIPGVRVIAIANSHEQEQHAWKAGAHIVVAAPVDPELLVRLLSRCAAELERDGMLRELAERVRFLRSREEKRSEERRTAATRSVQRALTMAAFKAHLLAETLSATCQEHSVRVQLSKELCSTLACAIGETLAGRPEPFTGAVALELRRMTDALRNRAFDVQSIRDALRSR